MVVGCPGAGKTTLAAELAEQLDLTHVELDNLYHRAGWTAASDREFKADLAATLDRADHETDGWTLCGNYNTLADDTRLARADTIVWLDPPRSTVMRRVIWRTIQRAALRRELWNGNREPLTNFYRWDPEKNIMRWAWTHHPVYRAAYEAKLTDGTWSHLTVFRVRSERTRQMVVDLAGR